MNRIVLFTIGLISSIHVIAQTNTFPADGNVGIGTTSPDSKLSVAGNMHTTGMIGGNGGYFNVLKITSLDSAPAYFYIDTNIPANDVSAPQIYITGYMYSATNKAMKTTLSWYYYAGNWYWAQYQNDLGYSKPSRIRLGKYLKNGSEYVRIEISNNSTYWSNYTISAMDRSDYVSSYYTGWSYTLGEMPASTTSQITTVSNQPDVLIDGKLGIGTNNPTEKLSVNGKIRAQEIKVETTNWPDYVFADDYKPASLINLEQFIKINRHLPGMPSAKDAQTNGIDLGDMNKKLLEKIEQLTLHLIELDKKVNNLVEENKELKKQKH